MKKIIYSLVIMIAAGSLFTSCIEQVEPLGIQDMRFAKAEYIRALKDLRAADAELQRALAAVELANARYRDAETANLNADTEYQKLLNEYQKLINEARQDTNDFIHNATISAIDSLKKEIELRELTHAKAMVDAEKELAQAKEELRVALRNISLAAGDLTGPEKVALAEAVAVYYGLTEEVIKQEYRVFKAQQKVDTLTEYALRFSDTAWNGYALVDMDDYFEDAIEWEEAKIAKWMEDYEAIPDSSARVAEWKAYVDRFADRENKLNYELAKIDAEETAITSLMKEGIKDFNLAIFDFIEENWEKTGTVYKEPSDPGDPKTQDDFTFDTTKDSLAIPSITVKTSDAGFPVYKKFADLVGEYDNLPAPQGKFKVKHNIAELDATTPGEVKLNVYSTTKLKGFIFGNTTGEVVTAPNYKDFDGNDIKGATAAYGIDGAISVLDRELVLAEKADDTDYEKLLHEADSTWQADRKVLENGLATFAPYVSAKTALTALGDAGKAEFFAAVKNLSKELSEINGDEELNFNDSAAVLGAIAAYAAARDKYLNDVDGDGKAVKYGKGLNPKYFYMAIGENAEGAILDSVLFSEINTQTRVKAVYYEYDKDYKHRDRSTEIGSRVASKVRGLDFALCNILNQLFPGKNMGDQIFGSSTAIALTLPIAPATTIFTPAYMIDSWEDPTKVVDPADYIPAAIKKAQSDVNAAIEKYMTIYKNYWDEVYPATLTYASTADDIKTAREQEYKVGIYTKETFEEPYTIVSFMGNQALYNNGLGAILSLIEPNATLRASRPDQEDWKSGVNLLGNHIFGVSNNTTFAKYMIAKQNKETHGALLPYKAALDDIKNWAEKVRKVFDAAIAKNGTPNKSKYEEWKKDYEPAKEAWDEYEAALIEFTGTRVDASGDTVINGVYFITSPFDASTITPPYPLIDVKNLFATNILGVYVGWIETLGGEQLANAIKAFGEEPWEKFNEWNKTKAQYNAQKTDLAGLKTKAENVFKAEAKMEGYDRVESAADFEAAYKAYVQAYKALRDAIVVYDEFGNIDMNNTEAKVNKAMQEIERLSHEAACYKSDVPDWEGLIAEAQKDLKVQEARLQSLKSALEYAKTNYEKLKEYILSQDASYVIPVSVADIQSLLKGLGIDINALIGTYLGSEEEVEPVVEP